MCKDKERTWCLKDANNAVVLMDVIFDILKNAYVPPNRMAEWIYVRLINCMSDRKDIYLERAFHRQPFPPFCNNCNSNLKGCNLAPIFGEFRSSGKV